MNTDIGAPYMMKAFQPKLLSSMKGYNGKKLANDLVAGLIVAIIALPLSIALAIASGASPAQGLYTAILAGFVIAMLGGSNVNISGPTAAFATIVAGVIASSGFDGLVIATVMAGILLIVMGLCRVGSLIRFMPYAITVGFTAGVAVTLLVGQIKDFLGLVFAPGTNAIETAEKAEAIIQSIGTFNLRACIVGVIALAILIVWPMIGKHTKGVASVIFTKIPPSIIAVVVGVLMVRFIPFFHGEVATIGSLYTLPSGVAALPSFSFPTDTFTLDKVLSVLPSAVTIALLAAIESLLSCVVSDEMIGDSHHSNTELIAQGFGNIASGLFGGIPATGAIARTAANVKNGGRSPIAGMVHAVVLLLYLLLLMPVAELIPMPVIAAILFMVAYNMCGWRSFVGICKTKKAGDIIVLIVTFVLTVVINLVVAIIAGAVLSVLFHFFGKLRKKNEAK